MRSLSFGLVVSAMIALAACSEGSNTPATPAAVAAPLPEGPLGYADVIANPAASIGRTMELLVTVVAGDTLFVSGETAVSAEQSWVDPAGKEHSVAPPPGFTVGPTCIFAVRSSDGTPVMPLQPIVVDKLQPCYAQSSFSSVKLTGAIAEVRDVQLLVDGQTATIKAPVLTSVDWKTPPL